MRINAKKKTSKKKVSKKKTVKKSTTKSAPLTFIDTRPPKKVKF